MAAYCDSNFLARFYLGVGLPRDLRSRLAEHALAERVPVMWLHRLEVVNALQAFVFLTRRGRPWRITAESAAAAQARFREDCINPVSWLRQVSVSLSDLEARFGELSLRHTANHGFRTYDLLHVSATLLLGCDTFWSFDDKANKLAALEGVKTLVTTVRG